MRELWGHIEDIGIGIVRSKATRYNVQNYGIRVKKSSIIQRDGWLVAKLVVRLLATADFWVRIQTSLKKTKWAT